MAMVGGLPRAARLHTQNNVPESFSTSAFCLTLLTIWAVVYGFGTALNISLQIIREDYHPVNIVFQVGICHFFYR